MVPETTEREFLQYQPRRSPRLRCIFWTHRYIHAVHIYVYIQKVSFDMLERRVSGMHLGPTARRCRLSHHRSRRPGRPRSHPQRGWQRSIPPLPGSPRLVHLPPPVAVPGCRRQTAAAAAAAAVVPAATAAAAAAAAHPLMAPPFGLECASGTSANHRGARESQACAFVAGGGRGQQGRHSPIRPVKRKN